MKLSVALIGMAWCAGAQTPGWNVAPDADKSTLTISHDALGVVLKDVRLNIRTAAGLVPVTGWTVQSENGRWSIRALSPASGWRIEATDQTLAVSGTSADSVLTATAPAGSERVVVRL